jgi:thiamine-monophosphate kinase
MGMAAQIDWSALPLGDQLRAELAEGRLSVEDARVFAAAGGDDYELLFSAAPSSRHELMRLAGQLQFPLTRIGEIISSDADSNIIWHDDHDQPLSQQCIERIGSRGFQHFSGQS